MSWTALLLFVVIIIVIYLVYYATCSRWAASWWQHVGVPALLTALLKTAESLCTDHVSGCTGDDCWQQHPQYNKPSHPSKGNASVWIFIWRQWQHQSNHDQESGSHCHYHECTDSWSQFGPEHSVPWHRYMHMCTDCLFLSEISSFAFNFEACCITGRNFKKWRTMQSFKHSAA